MRPVIIFWNINKFLSRCNPKSDYSLQLNSSNPRDGRYFRVSSNEIGEIIFFRKYSSYEECAKNYFRNSEERSAILNFHKIFHQNMDDQLF